MDGLKSDNAREVRRLRWQCRRGMLELDHLLSRFLDLGYSDLSLEGQQLFSNLLCEQDQRLSDWFMFRSEPDPHFRDLVEHIRTVAGEQQAAI